MPDEGNVPEKYRNKSAAELIKMHQEAEALIGQQGQRLGSLQQSVSSLDAQVKKLQAAGVDEGGTLKSQYVSKELADELILHPEKALPKIRQQMKDEVMAETTQMVQAKMDTDRQIDAFMRANPALQEWQEVFSIAGAQIYRANPNASLASVLEEAKKATQDWVKSAEDRIDKQRKTKRERVIAGTTTSGGGGARDTQGVGKTEEEEESLDPERQAVLNSIKELRTWREKKQLPVRAR